MGNQGYSMPNSFAFFIKEVGQGKGGTSGTVAVPVAPVAGDTHIPFNAFESIAWTQPFWKQIQAILAGDIIKTTFSPGGMEDGKFPIKDSFYHAPFVMAKIFPKKTVGAWAADGTATLAFTAALSDFIGEPESIAVHIHDDDKAASPNDIDVNLYGGMVEEYAWKWKIDDVLREDADIRFTNVGSGAIAYNSAPTFQNGKWAMWNDAWISDSKPVAIPFSAMYCSTYTALDAAIKIKGGEFRIKIPRQANAYFGSTSSSGLVEAAPRTHIEVETSLDVDIIDDEVYTQELLKFASRTDATFKVGWASGAYGEYLQCTKMKLDPDGEYEIPPASEGIQSKSLKFIPASDAVLSFAGLYQQSVVPVPTNYV
jgi:hypothetical protein